MPAGGHTWALLVLVGFGATTLGFLGMFHAAEFITPGLATVIANAQPLLAAILACVFLAERLGPKGNLGLVIGFVGIVAIAWPGVASANSNSYAVGIAYIALAATGVAIGNIAMKRLAGGVDALMAMGIQLLVGAIPLALLSLSTEDLSSVVWSTNFVLILMALAVLGTSLSFWLWFDTLQEAELNRANAFTFLVPVFGLVVGAAFFDERFGWFAGAGGALVVTGIALVQRDAHDRASPMRSA
jgi:drug/metabolite transporter (DMT)-like permease